MLDFHRPRKTILSPPKVGAPIVSNNRIARTNNNLSIVPIQMFFDGQAAADNANDSVTVLAYAEPMASLAEALSAAGVARTTSIASAAVDYAKANADAAVAFVGAIAGPGIAYATALAEANKTFAITSAEISKDENVAAAEAEKDRISALAASDPEFGYYGGGSSYYGGGGYGYIDIGIAYWLGLQQGKANIANGLQDTLIGLVNLTQMPGDWLAGAFGYEGGGYLNSPDWSNGLITQEGETAHGISKFAGAFGVETLTGAWAGRAAAAVDEAGRCAGWFSRLWNGGCFVPGTLVTLSDMPQGEQLQSVLWANDSFLDDITDSRGGIALLEAPTKTATTFKIPIEDVPLGARVPTKNPRPWEYDDSLAEPDEVTWAKVSITVERTDGGMVDAELIRPRSWIEANGLHEGTQIPMQIEELQIDGIAHVTSVECCPPISSGHGSIITARFITRQVDEVATITVLGTNGQGESLTGTTIHPIWSVDRQDWVPMGELREGETLQAADGLAIVASILIASKVTPVYNIEVHGEHVYQVGELLILVHNGDAFRCMNAAEYAAARIGKCVDSQFTDFPGFHFVWDNLDSAKKWLDFVRKNGDDQFITHIETRLDITEYEAFLHPPQGTAYIVPFENLGNAIQVL